MPPKSRKHVSEVDPIVVKVQETLEENLTYFIDNIAGLVRRYDGLLGRSLQLNQGTASEIAQLQTFMTSTVNAKLANNNNNDGDDKTGDDAAPASTTTTTTNNAGAATAGAESATTKTTTTTSEDVPPLVRQISSSTKGITSPLLKRAASPVTGSDSFPSVDKKTDDASAATAVATASSPKTTGSPKIGSKKDLTKKIRIVEVKFPDNTEIVKQLRLLKRESYELGATMDGIHDWIALNVPDIKDDENDGVEVMGAVIEQVTSLADTVRSVYSAEAKYLEERAELEKSMLKLPESETMKLAIKSHDGDTWDEIDRGWRTLIRVCLLLYSILSKNMAMLKEPRKQTSNQSAMFM
jgi:hypothetical protein